jgi:threonine aldolase
LEGEARLMSSWDTTAEDVEAFAADLTELTAHYSAGQRVK